MKFQEIANRLTGISTPIFGVSWEPPQLEITVARKVITFLEDRRVLYSPSEMEVPRHCVTSILEIRRFLTAELMQLDSKSQFTAHLRAMRSACRKFLETMGHEDSDVIRFGGQQGHWASWKFNGALGEMRGVFGVHIAAIAAQNGLDVEDDLAEILPSSDSPI